MGGSAPGVTYCRRVVLMWGGVVRGALSRARDYMGLWRHREDLWPFPTKALLIGPSKMSISLPSRVHSSFTVLTTGPAKNLHLGPGRQNAAASVGAWRCLVFTTLRRGYATCLTQSVPSHMEYATR